VSGISKKHLPRGEDSLADLEAIEVTLENGTTRRFNIAAELSPLPTSPAELVREAENTIARLAFWGYQAERAKSAAIRAEAMADKAWAVEYGRQRRHIQENTDVEIATENNIKHRIVDDGRLEIPNSHVRGAWKRYGALRSLTTALEHRSHLIRLLIRRDSDAKAFGT
jgi:hypothetical protein